MTEQQAADLIGLVTTQNETLQYILGYAGELTTDIVFAVEVVVPALIFFGLAWWILKQFMR